MSSPGYNGNPNLPKAYTKYNWTQNQVQEYIKCKEDPVYFAETYFKIVHVDHGIVPFKLYEFQREAVEAFKHTRKLVINASRQVGKTSIATVIILHYALFNDSKKIALLANKADMAQEILSRIQLAYEYLPSWLKCGVAEWNKRRVEFDNGSIILAAASSASSIRGNSCVAGDTIVTIKSRLTGKIETITMSELKKRLHQNKENVKYDKAIFLDGDINVSFGV